MKPVALSLALLTAACGSSSVVVVTTELPPGATRLEAIVVMGGKVADSRPSWNVAAFAGKKTSFGLRLPSGASGPLVIALGVHGKNDCVGAIGQVTTDVASAAKSGASVELGCIDDCATAMLRDRCPETDHTDVNVPQILNARPSVMATTGNEILLVRGWGFTEDGAVTVATLDGKRKVSPATSWSSPIELVTQAPPLPGVIGPVSVTVTQKSGVGESSFVLRYFATTVSFAKAVAFPLDTYPTEIAVGDLDDDGFPDVAVLQLDSVIPNNLSILLNDGDGTFKPAVKYPVKAPIGLAIADIDGDGALDVIVSTYTTNLDSDPGEILVFHNRPEALGQLTQLPALPTRHYAQSLAVGDINLDGKPDLALITRNVSDQQVVSVFLNQGGGTFNVKSDDYVLPDNANRLLISDLNADGYGDVVATLPSVDSVAFLLGRAGGTLGNPKILAVGHRPTWLAAGDLNNDNLLELLVGDEGIGASNGLTPLDDSIALLVNNGSNMFAPPTHFPIRPASMDNNTTYGIALGDLDGDGCSDVVVTDDGDGRVRTMLADKDPTLGCQASFAPGRSMFLDVLTGASPLAVVVADMDNDGKSDIVIATPGQTRAVTVVRNTSE